MFNFKNLFRNGKVDDIIDTIKARGAIEMTYDVKPVEVPWLKYT